MQNIVTFTVYEYVRFQITFYISVYKGSSPITGLDVTVHITYPDDTVLELKLRDNGAGDLINM